MYMHIKRTKNFVLGNSSFLNCAQTDNYEYDLILLGIIWVEICRKTVLLFTYKKWIIIISKEWK